jgi:ribosome recycling factor
MDEEVKMQLDLAKEGMDHSLIHLDGELIKVRAGKANIHMLDGIFVDYYGTNTALNQVANVNTPDPRMIVIQPWEKSMIEPIEKAILKANVGVTPVNDGELIRLNIPPLTEERRRELVKMVKSEGENAKVSIRNTRRDANEEFKQMKKDGLAEDMEKWAEGEVQKLTDSFIKKVDEIVSLKESEIMTI